MCTIVCVSRTNVVIDDELVERAMQLYGLRTRREAVDLALRELVGRHERKDILDLIGVGWAGDLDTMRGSGPAE